MKKAVITWDGKHLPPQLKKIPPGEYLLDALPCGSELAPAEERGIELALRQLDAGEGKSLASVLTTIRGRRKRS